MIPDLTISPALAHAAIPGRLASGPSKSEPVSDATRTVTLPFPVSGWCTKVNRSFTSSPVGPIVGVQAEFGPYFPQDPDMPGARPNTRISPAAATSPRTQPRTVRNFVHSACSTLIGGPPHGSRRRRG